MCLFSYYYCSDWGSLCVHDFRYDVQLFNYDLFRPTSFSTYDDDDDSNGECIFMVTISMKCISMHAYCIYSSVQ